MSAALKIQDFDDPTYDPFAASEDSYGRDIHDIYTRIAQLGKQNAVHPYEFRVLFGLTPDMTTADMKHYSVFGYDLVQEIYSKPEIFSNKLFERMLGPGFGRTVSTMDGAEHTRYRRLFQAAFMPNVIASWGDSLVQPVVDELVQKFAKRGSADLVKDFTRLYPFHIIYRQLGLPAEDRTVFHKLAVSLTVSGTDPGKAMEAGNKLGAYYEALTEL